MEIKLLLSKIKNTVLVSVFRLLPVNKKKIIMWNSVFRQYGCNPKYITEYLIKNYPGRYDIVWAVARGIKTELPDGVRRVDYFSVKYLYEIATCGIVISNIRTYEIHWFKKRKKQLYIQTWHSSLRLKKIEGDASDKLGEKYIESAKKDSAKCDVIVSGCDFSTRIYENSFWYNGDILKIGTPRCDILFTGRRQSEKKVCETYGITGKYILYVPTFRDSHYNPAVCISTEKAVAAAEERFGGKWNFIYRFHPNISDSEGYEMQGGVNATFYSDIQELVSGAGIMITDYSSCMFDAALANIPCVLFQPDLNAYLTKERGLYFKMNELPFPSALTDGELYTIIKHYDISSYESECKSFADKIGNYEDGKSCKRLAEFINERTAEK